MNKRVRGAASLSPSRDATTRGPKPGEQDMERRPSGQEALRQENLRCDEKQRRQDGDASQKKAAVRMSALFLPRAYHASPVFPSSNRAAVAVNSDTPSRMHASRIHGCSSEHADLHELRRRPHPARGQQRQQHKRDLPYPRLSSPNEQCEQHTADGKRVLSGTPEVRAAQYKSQRGRGKAQNRTHDAHGRLLSGGIPHLIRCGMICRDRRHVSRLSPQALGLQRPSSWTSTRSPETSGRRDCTFPLPLRPLTSVIRNGLFLPAALSTGK